MPSPTLKRKMRKIFSRKSQNYRRASTQASPASRPNIVARLSDIIPPRPVSSNVIMTTCTETLQLPSEIEGAEGSFASIKDIQMQEPLSSNGVETDFDLINAASAVYTKPLSGTVEVPKRASLMGLPVELRIMIFKCVFPPSDGKGATETVLYCAPTLRVLGPSHSQLCRVSRQIYEETRGLLYGQTLVFLSREALTKFSDTRTILQLSHLRNICMKERVTDWSSAIKTLVLPTDASLTVHWPITRELWQALIANITLDYRPVTVVCTRTERSVIFEPAGAIGAGRLTYETLKTTFENNGRRRAIMDVIL